MIDYEKLKKLINKEIDFHLKQCEGKNQNSTWFAMHTGAHDALVNVLELMEDKND